MFIETKYLGKVEIDENKIIHFPAGLPGFSDERSFIILDIPENNHIQILQSTETKNLAFFITNPHQFYPTYEFSLDESIVEKLHIKSQSDVAILSIMTIKQPFAESTINLKAPLIINSKAKEGKQHILNDDKYEMKATISTSEKVGE